MIAFSTLHHGKTNALSENFFYPRHLGTISSHWPELKPEDFSEFWATLVSTKNPFEIFYALLLEMPENAIPKLVWQAERLANNFFSSPPDRYSFRKDRDSFRSTMLFFILHTTNHERLCDLWTIFYEHAYVSSDRSLQIIAEFLLTTTSTRHLSTEEGTVFLRKTLDEQCAQVQNNAVSFNQNTQDIMYYLLSKMIIISTLYDNNHHLSDIHFNFMSSHFAPGQPPSEKKNHMLLALLKITNYDPHPIMKQMGSAGYSEGTLEHFISTNVEMLQVKDKWIKTTNEIIKVIELLSTLVTEDFDADSALLGQTMNDIETSNQEFLSIIKNTEGNKTQDDISLMVKEALHHLISQIELSDNARAPKYICIKVEMLIPYLKDERHKGMLWCQLLTLLEYSNQLEGMGATHLFSFAQSFIPTLLVTLMPEDPAVLGSDRARRDYCKRLAVFFMECSLSSAGEDEIIHNTQKIFSTLTPQSRVVVSYLITDIFSERILHNPPGYLPLLIKLFAALYQDLALNEKNLFWDQIQHHIFNHNEMRSYLDAIQELVPFINQINSVDITQQIKCFMHTLEMGLSNFSYGIEYTKDSTSDYGNKLKMIIWAIPAIAASVINKEQQLLIYEQYGTFFFNKPFNIKLELSRVVLGTHPNMEPVKNTLYQALVALELSTLNKKEFLHFILFAIENRHNDLWTKAFEHLYDSLVSDNKNQERGLYTLYTLVEDIYVPLCGYDLLLRKKVPSVLSLIIYKFLPESTGSVVSSNALLNDGKKFYKQFFQKHLFERLLIMLKNSPLNHRAATVDKAIHFIETVVMPPQTVSTMTRNASQTSAIVSPNDPIYSIFNKKRKTSASEPEEESSRAMRRNGTVMRRFS